MFCNLYEEAKKPAPMVPPVPKEPGYPSYRDRQAFVAMFAVQRDPKSWLENMGVGESYSTNVCDADFLRLFAVEYLRDPMLCRSEMGEQFFELMGDLCDLARRAGNF